MGKHIIARTTILAVRPVVTEYPPLKQDAPPIERRHRQAMTVEIDQPASAKPQRTPLTWLEWIAALLWFLPCFVWLCWLTGLSTIEPDERTGVIEGTVIFFGLGLLVVCAAAWRKH